MCQQKKKKDKYEHRDTGNSGAVPDFGDGGAEAAVDARAVDADESARSDAAPVRICARRSDGDAATGTQTKIKRAEK